MTIENKFNTPKAIELRGKLYEVGNKIESLNYELFLLQKESEAIMREYTEYLGIKEKKENGKA